MSDRTSESSGASSLSRRGLLASSSSLTGIGLAGCAGDDGPRATDGEGPTESPADTESVPDDEPGAGGDTSEGPEEPVLAARWSRSSDHFLTNTDLLERWNVNRVWYGVWPPEHATGPDYEREYEYIHDQGFPIVAGPGGADEEALLADHPDWEESVSRYFQSRPVEADDESLEIDVLDGFPTDDEGVPESRLNTEFDPDQFVRVVDTTAEEAVPTDQWSLEQDGPGGTVTIDGSEPGHTYTVFFLGTDRGGQRINKLLPAVQESEEYWNSRLTDSSAVRTSVEYARSIQVADFGHYFVRSEDGLHHDWWTYGPTITPTTVDHFESESGDDVDPSWWIDDTHRLRDTEDPPTAGLLEWMDSVQEQVLEYAQAYTDWVHDHDTKAVLFWGDGWTGIEPYEGMIGEAGYDEVTQPTNQALDARRVTDFEDDGVTRIVRYWTRGDPPSESLLSRWRNSLRAMLRVMPDGVSIGGNVADVYDEYPEYGETLTDVYREFREIHEAIDGTEAYTVDLTVYVLNAWGELRSWPRAPWIQNPSQSALKAVTDLPVEVEFVSLQHVAEEGVPEDADVLLNVGEPGTAWSGDFHWSEAATEAVRSFVADGGGLIGIDAPALNDDEFVLADVYGLEYGERVSTAAEREIYRHRASLWQDFEAPPRARLSVTEDAPDRFDGLGDLGLVQTNVAMTPTSASVWARGRNEDSGTDAVATLDDHGDGQAAYLTGNVTPKRASDLAGDSGYLEGEELPTYEESLKRLIYTVAGEERIFERLDAPTPGAHVYFYPDSDVLIVYNRASGEESVTVRAGAVADAYGDRVELRGVYLGRGEPSVFTDAYVASAADLSSGLEIDVPEGTVRVYEVRAAGREVVCEESPGCQVDS
jgi:hypothetical protein